MELNIIIILHSAKGPAKCRSDNVSKSMKTAGRQQAKKKRGK